MPGIISIGVSGRRELFRSTGDEAGSVRVWSCCAKSDAASGLSAPASLGRLIGSEARAVAILEGGIFMSVCWLIHVQLRVQFAGLVQVLDDRGAVRRWPLGPIGYRQQST